MLLQVTGAFFGSDFVTVSKTEDYNWSVLKPDIFAAIMDHFSSGEPLFTDASATSSDTAINDDDTEVRVGITVRVRVDGCGYNSRVPP